MCVYLYFLTPFLSLPLPFSLLWRRVLCYFVHADVGSRSSTSSELSQIEGGYISIKFDETDDIPDPTPGYLTVLTSGLSNMFVFVVFDIVDNCCCLVVVVVVIVCAISL